MLWWLCAVPAAASVLLSLVHDSRRRTLAAVGAGALGLTLALALAATRQGWAGSYRVGPGIELAVSIDFFAGVMAMLVAGVGLPIVAYACAHGPERGRARLAAVLAAFVAAMELLVLAADFLTLLVAWELVGALSWAAIANSWRDPAHGRAAHRVFLVTRSGDLGLFLAAAVSLAGTGSFAYASLSELEPAALSLLTAGVVVAAAAKSAQLPFSPWLFAAMRGPTSASALLHAAAMVAAGAYLLARLEPALSRVPWFGPTVLAIGLSTALLAGAVAVCQQHAKKLLAASTSAHFGLIWSAIGTGHPAVALAHLLVHGTFKPLLFLIVDLLGSRVGGYSLGDLARVSMPRWLGVLAILACGSLAGAPPFAAAWTKEAILRSAASSSVWAAVVTALAVGTSAIYAYRLYVTSLAWSSSAAPRAESREHFERESVSRECVSRESVNPESVNRESAPRDATPRARGPGMSPSLLESSALVLLGVLVVAASLAVWWPHLADRFLRSLGGAPETAHAWEAALAWGALALGLYAGRVVSALRPALGDRPAASGVGEWLGLTVYLPALVEPRVRACVSSLRRLDHRCFAVPVQLAAQRARVLAKGLARFDARVLEAAVSVGARSLCSLARGSVRFGEAGIAAAAAGVARLVLTGGSDASRTQTGRVHYEYAAIALITALLIGVTLSGGT